MADCVLVEAIDRIAVVSLDRPSRLNALDLETASALSAALAHVGQTPQVAAVIITGRGRAFCAGGDLAWITRAGADAASAISQLADQFHQAIIEICTMAKPVIAAVSGIAAGGGFSLALACDFRVLSQDALFCHAYTSAGLSMDGGTSLTLPRVVGYARALDIAAFDEPILADRAAALGLATEVVDGDPFDAAVTMARRLTQRSLAAFGMSKRLLTTTLRAELEQQLNRERDGIAEMLTTAEGVEGVSAFVEKRRPNFEQARTKSKS